MAASPRNGDGSGQTEPSVMNAAAEKAATKFRNYWSRNQPRYSRNWFNSLLHLVRGSRRSGYRVPPEVYAYLFGSLERFVEYERPGGHWTKEDRALADWILIRPRRGLPWHPALNSFYDPSDVSKTEVRDPDEMGGGV
jgi:hypothetical protein